MSTVLVVEDNPDNMTLICDILQLNGCRIQQAMTGEQGLEMARSGNPDYIILDIQLPDIDGNKVLEKIRADDRINNIPVIAMTSYAMAGDRERLLKAGCDGYIEKPIDPEIVMEQIKQSLNRRNK